MYNNTIDNLLHNSVANICHYSSFGEIKTLRLPRKAGGSRSGHRGFAFVEYLSKEEAKVDVVSFLLSVSY